MCTFVSWYPSLSSYHVSQAVRVGTPALMSYLEGPLKFLKSETLIITTRAETMIPCVYMLVPRAVPEAQDEGYSTPSQKASLE